MLGRKKKVSATPSTADYEQLGRQIDRFLVRDYLELLQGTKRLFWLAFMRGILVGLGGVIGATVMVTLLLFLLSYLGGLPVVGDFFRNLGHTLSTGTRR